MLLAAMQGDQGMSGHERNEYCGMCDSGPLDAWQTHNFRALNKLVQIRQYQIWKKKLCVWESSVGCGVPVLFLCRSSRFWQPFQVNWLWTSSGRGLGAERGWTVWP